jgi:hypothetical protein
MSSRFLFSLLAGAAAASLRAEPLPDDPREIAKREAWSSTVLIVSLLEQGDNQAFPGIRAWLEDFRHVAATTPPPDSGKPFPPLDTDALVTRNPHFWSAFYEVQPGDPGLALLHSALLLSGGEAQRAAAMANFGLQRHGIPEDIKHGLTSILAHCQSAQATSFELVRDGVRFYDVRYYSGALEKFDAAIADWPANGWAHYERGSTLRMKAILEAQRNPSPETAETGSADGDPPATVEAFAHARKHDPMQLLAYQGDNPALCTALMALVQSGVPVWDAIRKHPEQLVKPDSLKGFSEACRVASIDDFALVLRQLVVAATRRFHPEDEEFIRECLGRLAPAALTESTLARIGGEARPPARAIVIPLVIEPPLLAEHTDDTTSDDEPKEKAPAAKSKNKGKSAKTSTKSKRKAAKEEDPPTKSKSKSKKRKS